MRHNYLFFKLLTPAKNENQRLPFHVLPEKR